MLKEGRFWGRGSGCPETGILTRDGYEWSPETHYHSGGFGSSFTTVYDGEVGRVEGKISANYFQPDCGRKFFSRSF